MLDLMIEAALEAYLREDTPELHDLCKDKAQEIKREKEMTEEDVQEILETVGAAYEDAGFRAGFKACAACLQALIGKE